MKEMLPAFLSCQGLRLSADEKRLFSEYNPLGVCLFSKFCENVRDKEQVLALTDDIKNAIGRENVLIAVDQEGGRVRRLLDPEFTAVSAQQNITSPEMAMMHAYLISSDLKSCGINVNFAPVLDIMTDKTSEVLQGRCFENNVAKLGKAMVDEYIKNGICPCVKHIPGHGKAAVDPHLSLPVINESLAELQVDFAPFKALCNAPMGMVAHIVLSVIDKQNAATISSKVINDIIRKEIGFSGLLVSDAIVMGCEVICLGNADFKANQELCESGIKMDDETTKRLQKIFSIVDKKCEFAEYEQIKNKYCANLKNIITYDYNYDATEVLNRLRDNN